MVVDSREVAQRFANADGRLFVTLDSPDIKRARALNETLFTQLKDDPKSQADLFVTSPAKNRQTVQIGSGLSGEWWTQTRLVGPNIKIGQDVNLLGHGGIEIGENAEIGDRVNIDTIGHPNNPVQRNTAFTGGPIIIKPGAKIGSGAILIAPRGKPLIIGENAKVANGSVVKADVPDNSSVAGVLAKKTEESVECTFSAPNKSRDGFEVVQSAKRAKEIFGAGADVKFPIYVRGAQNISVEGSERLGINLRAVFDLGGPLSIKSPFKMATDASIKVEKGAHLQIDEEAFLYMNASVTADHGLTIGSNAILGAGATVNQNVAANSIVGGRNRVIGQVNGDPIDPSVMPSWNDSTSLAPKVAAFQDYKKSFIALPLDEIKSQAVEADKTLSSFVQKLIQKAAFSLHSNCCAGTVD